MKKLFPLLLAMVLVFNLTSVSAANTAPLPGSQPAGLSVRIPAEVKKDLADSRASFPKPNDTVAIKDGVITITSNNVTVEFQVPFGWIGLTQDITKQMTDYAMMTDPLAVLNSLINNNLSILAVEPQTNALMFAFFVADNLSILFNDLQSQEMLDIALTTYAGTAVVAGDRNYVSVIEDGTLIFFTFYNGVRVGFQLILAGAEPTSDEIEILTAFVEPTKYI